MTNTPETKSTKLEREKIKNASTKKRKKWIVLVFLIIILLLGLTKCQLDFKTDTTNNILELENGQEWNGQLPQNGEVSEAGNQESISIPGYSMVYGPEIQLINPADNDVYFIYKIYKDESLVYESKLISPNHVAIFNASDVLGQGRHQVQFQIETYDMETQQQYNGANMNVEIINE